MWVKHILELPSGRALKCMSELLKIKLLAIAMRSAELCNVQV